MAPEKTFMPFARIFLKTPVFRFLLFAVIFCAAILVSAELAYRAYKGTWYFQDRARSSRGMVQIHPYFGACLVPGKKETRNRITISHNSFRCRGPEITKPKPPKVVRIVTLGGSSTYCVGVSDGDTWPHLLQECLGKNFEVVNLGGPGGTSLETLVQSSLLFSELQPDFAIYYLGWNDARVQHVQNLWPDYSDSHGRWVTSFGLSGRDLNEPFALGYLLKRAAFHYFFPGNDPERILGSWKGTSDALSGRVDKRALALYERNLRTILAVCSVQGVIPVFVPQIMNSQCLTADKPYGWLPFVRDRDLPRTIQSYNETMKSVARDNKALFASGVLQAPFEEEDFLDQGHFTPKGNLKFAQTLAQDLKLHDSSAIPPQKTDD